MTSRELREKFLDFFKGKGHTIIPPASLIPENDPTVLFTTAGMHPLVPFLLGEKHPGGKRLANCQPCIRTDDIDEVGDEVHHTFFEMLGNWSLGDYFKEEAIKLSFEFLTSEKWLGIDKEKLAISVFAGDPSTSSGQVPKDEESKNIWLSLGIPEERIKYLGRKDNWWGPAGQTGPCGPDTEMFYWVGPSTGSGQEIPKEFDPKDKRWVEIWNDVFMQYFKNMPARIGYAEGVAGGAGKYEPLSQRNVDTGMGLERTVAAINGLDDDYKTDLFWPIIQQIEKSASKPYSLNPKPYRIIADHIKAAVFIVGDRRGVEPSNLGQGYVARRLIRRAIRYGKMLDLSGDFLTPLVKKVVEIYGDFYTEIKSKENYIVDVVKKEAEKFEKALVEGSKEFEKGRDAFTLYTTYGFPIELILEIAKEKGREIDVKKFEEELKKHQELSRTASAGMFKGGLADSGEMAAKYHTATHLLLAALRQVLGEHVFQRGSNINAERLRFDFSHPQKMTSEEIRKVEDIVNQKIKEDIPVVCQEMPLEEAKKKNMMGIFENKYGDKVKTYAIKEFSKEICGGPHAKRTGELGKFKIIKEESSASGVRRIKAVLE